MLGLLGYSVPFFRRENRTWRTPSHNLVSLLPLKRSLKPPASFLRCWASCSDGRPSPAREKAPRAQARQCQQAAGEDAGTVRAHLEHLEALAAAKGLLPQLSSPCIAVLSEGPESCLDQLAWGLTLTLPSASATNQDEFQRLPADLWVPDLSFI